MPLSVTRPFLMPASDSATVTTFSSLCAMSHALEDVVIQGLPGAQLAVGFQRLSAFQRQEQRYRSIAAACDHVWVCAVPDEKLPEIDGVTFVPICAEWPVADEWFVVVNAPGFASALLAIEVSCRLSRDERCFQTMFTSDVRLVNAICRSLAIELDMPIETPTTRDPEAQQLNLRSFNRLVLEHQERQLSRRSYPLITRPRWTPPLVSSHPFGERAVGSADV